VNSGLLDLSSPSEALLDAALESIPYGFCVWDRDFHLVMWNKNYREIYGFPLERMYRGMSLLEVVRMSGEYGNHPDQSPQEFYDAYTRELLENRGGARTRALEMLSGGRTIETAHVFSPGLGWVITHEDVTEELAATELVQRRKRELELQNLRLDAAVNNMSQGLCMYDAQGALVIRNEPFRALYDLPADMVRPGTRFEAIVGFLFDRGLSANTDRDSYVGWRRQLIDRREYGTEVHQYLGRTILMHHHPMKDGGWVSTHEDITEQRKTEARIRHLARHDGLTDLPNRKAFLEDLEKAEPAIRRGEAAAVLCLDLDHFKGINETYGHGFGDALLVAAAGRLGAAMRETDLLARLDGDEFAILLKPVEAPRDAAIVADRILKTLAQPFDIEGKVLSISASVGIAVAPGDGHTTEALVKNADLALHRAKGEGRASYAFFEPGMDALQQRRRLIEAGLRQALLLDELRIVFQPLVGLKENRITCFEALLRWRHKELGDISPAEFIPVAEETGLIVPIGEWVLREATKLASGWPSPVRVAVNLSSIQFKNRNLVELVQSALHEAGLVPTRLELEITESLLLAENDATLQTLHGLRALGVRISMDDFGTGYSSLSYLRSFPFDKIKIDRSFMRDLTDRGDSLAIIKAVIGLGHSLGMSTTAEGVETQEQLDAVRSQGCDEVQGFLFSPPVTPEAAAALLHAESNHRARLRAVG
jgi:diguanylate cyclase (GGDEF)-like protein